MFTLTKSRALQIQSEQIDWYARIYGERVREVVKAATTAARLDGEGPHNVVEINRHNSTWRLYRGADRARRLR